MLEILPPGLELWLMCTRKTKSLRSHSTFFFFPFLQVALSLEGHSSEVQVVKHLLHVRPHLPSPLQPLQGSSASTWCMVSPWAPKALGSTAGSPGARDVPISSFPCSAYSMEIPQPRMSLVSVLFTNVLPRGDEKTKRQEREQRSRL